MLSIHLSQSITSDQQPTKSFWHEDFHCQRKGYRCPLERSMPYRNSASIADCVYFLADIVWSSQFFIFEVAASSCSICSFSSWLLVSRNCARSSISVSFSFLVILDFFDAWLFFVLELDFGGFLGEEASRRSFTSMVDATDDDGEGVGDQQMLSMTVGLM